MKRRDMGELFAKVLGVFLLYWFFNQPYFLFFARGPLTSDDYYIKFTALGLLSWLFLTGLLCLFKSKTVGRWLYPDNPDGLLIEQINALEVQVIMFSTLGLGLIIVGGIAFLQQVTGYLAIKLEQSRPGSVQGDEIQMYFFASTIATAGIQLILGILVFSRARKWSERLLQHQRT